MARRLITTDRNELRLVRPLTQRNERRRMVAEVVASAPSETHGEAVRDTILAELPREVEATPATRQIHTLS